MASKEVKQKLQRCLMNRRSFKRTETEREKAHVSALNSQHENPNTPPSSHPRGKQLWRTASDSVLKHKLNHSSGSSCTKCQYSPPTAQSDHTPQLWDKSVQPYHQMDRNVNVIGPVEMWIQHPLTHSHENMLQRFILLKHVYIEVNPQLAVLQGACVSVRQHRPLHRCHSQPLILNEQPCGFYQCRSVQRPKRLLHTHKTIPTRVCVIHQEQHHLQAEKRTEKQEKGDVQFIVGEDHSIDLQEELCEDSSQLSPSAKWLCRPKLGLQSRSHQRLTHTHSCPPATATATADSAPDFALRTGLMYDPQMLKQQCICGNSSCRTEHAGKVPRVFARLQECGVSNQCKWISGKQCSMEYQSSLFVLAVKTAAACVTDLLLRVAQGRLKNGFAIVQTHGPDASHSSPSKSVVNPVAVAAEHLLKKLNNRKILILDWDVHHCHTTPKIFYKDPNILHISLHCYGNATPGATPMSGAGRLDEVDLGDGNGFNVNVEWSCDLDPPIGDAEYLAAFRTVIRPIARQFSPEIILISTEFNTAEGHPESCRGPRVSAKCFGLLTQSLMELSGGHVVLVLERGHDHPAVCEASAACVNALLQNKVETLSEYVLIKKPCAAAVQSLHRVLQIHSQYWSSMRDLTHTIGESWLQAEGKHSAQTDTASALASLSMTTPNYPGISYPEMLGLCGGGNEPVEHDEDEDEDKTLM
ncbi:histone deacetylase 4 isoform X2 [Silurus meridionalis]|uniref:histone deacetylase 4 isoform X2 n=1 Tax=Silurus meridionalis TaxID=175797 RepID=UPI001EEBE966|nr:histone deacetylase 4 isoform X2 [Silurus meridionalis]